MREWIFNREESGQVSMHLAVVLSPTPRLNWQRTAGQLSKRTYLCCRHGDGSTSSPDSSNIPLAQPEADLTRSKTPHIPTHSPVMPAELWLGYRKVNITSSRDPRCTHPGGTGRSSKDVDLGSVVTHNCKSKAWWIWSPILAHPLYLVSSQIIKKPQNCQIF